MGEPVMKSHIILAALWIGWCVLHSAMITPAATRGLEKRFGGGARFYRLLYNIVALATLIPVAGYERSIASPAVWSWDGPFGYAQAALVAVAMTLFITGGRHYDLRRFLGLRQLGGDATGKGLTESGHIDTSGVLGVTRHPWYAGAIALLWSSDMNGARLVTNIVLTTYLIVGTYIEEKKLIAEYGDEYREYQKRVPMLLPIGFLTSRRKG